MWPNNFEYTRAASVSETISLLQQNDDAKILAGGHSLLPAMKLRLNEPALLVDIGRISSLKSISANGRLVIGALSTHAEIAASSQIQRYAAALASACSKVGDPAVRNFGTLGGNIAHADPASDPPTVLTALDAAIHVEGPDGIRSVSASDFFVDLFTTDLQPYELVTAIEIPDHSSMKTAYVKMSHPASRYAVVGVSVALQMSGGTCQSARVAIGGATVKAVRSSGAEAALTGSSLDANALKAAADAAMNDAADYITGDITFPEAYRHAMVGVYVKRAVAQAVA